MQASGRMVAVKIMKSAERYKSVAEHEVALLSAAAKTAAKLDPDDDTTDELTHDDGKRRRRRTSRRRTDDGPPAQVLRLWERFELVAPKSGRHPCLVFERLGPCMLQLAKRCPRKQLPFSVTRRVAQDVLLGLDFLHRHCGIVHTDVKPENILLRIDSSGAGGSDIPPAKKLRLSDPTDGDCASGDRASKIAAAVELAAACTGKEDRRALLKGVMELFDMDSKCGGCATRDIRITFCLADFGNGCFVDALRSGRGTCQYKSPEVLLGSGFNCSADLWSLGCMLYECASGGYLFDPRYVARRRRVAVGAPEDGSLPEEMPRDEEHLAQTCELLGALPESLTRRGSKTRDLLRRAPSRPDGEQGRWVLRKTGIPLDTRPRHGGLMGRFHRRAYARNEAGGTSADIDALADFVSEVLKPEPCDRPSARELLQRPFFNRSSIEAEKQ